MKKLSVLLLMLLAIQANAQNNPAETEPTQYRKNEIAINAFELIMGGIVPISYERLLNDNQGLGVKLSLLDKHYNDFFQENYGTVSIQSQYNFYFSDRRDHYGFYTAPFLKYTTGTASSSDYYYYNGNSNNSKTKYDYDVNAFIVGFELGYKILAKKRFLFSITTDLGRVLNTGDYYRSVYSSSSGNLSYSEYGPVEFRAGLNMGYRF